MRNGGLLETGEGKILVDNRVIAEYAGSVAVESFGIVGMAAVNVQDGIVHLLKKNHISHGIHVTVDENNGIYIDLHIIVAYGVSILSVTNNLIDSIKYKLNVYTGMEVKDVNVFVEGVRVID